VEIANIHAVVTHIAEKLAGYGKRLGEYPTLSATFQTPNERAVFWRLLLLL
jgi:hypothetical protein